MKGVNHELAAFIIGGATSLFLLFNNFSTDAAAKLFIGCAILSLWFSSDNDSPKSRPIQRWGILKFIWRPFINAGHREILHSMLWGPVILCMIPAVPIAINSYHTHGFGDVWFLVGLIESTELHIATDKISSIKNAIKKAVKRAIPF